MNYDPHREPWEQDMGAIERAAYQRGDMVLCKMAAALEAYGDHSPDDFEIAEKDREEAEAERDAAQLELQEMTDERDALRTALDNAYTEFQILAEHTRGENRRIAKRAMQSLTEVG